MAAALTRRHRQSHRTMLVVLFLAVDLDQREEFQRQLQERIAPSDRRQGSWWLSPFRRALTSNELRQQVCGLTSAQTLVPMLRAR